MKKSLTISLIFILINLLSPWFWVLVKNFSSFKISKTDWYQLKNESRIYQINTLRGEAQTQGFGFLGKLAVNKYTWNFREILGRAEESFDPYFLFFKGDLEVKRSNWVFGPVYWFLAPFSLSGLLLLTRQKRIQVLILGLFLAFLWGLFEQHYFSFPRMPLFLLFNWFSALGLKHFFSKKGYWGLKLGWLFLAFFEVSRFIHDFFLHYPNRMIRG